MAPRSLRKFWQEAFEKMFLKDFYLKRDRKRTYIYKLCKVNALRKERSASQEEACLRFNQAEENVKAALVTVFIRVLCILQ